MTDLEMAERLYRAARERGMSRQAVSRLSGVSYGALVRWEAGTSRLSRANIERLVRALGPHMAQDLPQVPVVPDMDALLGPGAWLGVRPLAPNGAAALPVGQDLLARGASAVARYGDYLVIVPYRSAPLGAQEAAWLLLHDGDSWSVRRVQGTPRGPALEHGERPVARIIAVWRSV